MRELPGERNQSQRCRLLGGDLISHPQEEWVAGDTQLLFAEVQDV